MGRAALVAIVTIAALTACVGPSPHPASGGPTAGSTPPTSSSRDLPDLPVADFPGLACEQLARPDVVAGLLGDGAATVAPSIAEAPVLQDGGTVCAWADDTTGASLTIRLVGEGVDHWAAFNHWYEHTDWTDTVGEINGTRCSDDGCSIHALDGERFIEVDSVGLDDPDGQRTEDVARAALAAAPAPTPHPVASGSGSAPGTGSRSCTATLPEASVQTILGTGAAGASYVSTATPSYHLVQDALTRVGGLDCRLLSADSRELLRFTVLPGGAWLFRDDAPIDGAGIDDAGSAGDEDASETAQRGDDWVNLRAPGADEETTRALLAELLR
ncbi:hypothetical protein ITJ57_02655 [Plantibacter sp. VKM Ac-2880]|uniref:hypothetical protein n=1 Tax=Plantibacter sp. VKM Ac-2880 TaxID=2783827 RepID=UPI00188E73B8|nr:hypothetical protein [Plantibacter sp. VKM Ac-2880]MBF4567656.1 hypothetical protein [Plantibacter sp. VKM Ac-2880]